MLGGADTPAIGPNKAAQQPLMPHATGTLSSQQEPLERKEAE